MVKIVKNQQRKYFHKFELKQNALNLEQQKAPTLALRANQGKETNNKPKDQLLYFVFTQKIQY